jgi:inosine-uridine nucleoside N-ribohydrolase
MMETGVICWKGNIPLVLGLILMVMIVSCQRDGEPVPEKTQEKSSEKIPLLILDTDISSDVDDAGAAALLHGLADQGRARILAMMVSSGDPWSVPCLDAVNTWFGRPDIPIGMVRGKSVRHESKYTRTIAEEFAHNSGTGADAPDAVDLYRRILTAQADRSVTLVTVGYLTNLRNLLQSKPDERSPLNGVDLVRKKVQRLICMGGKYPSGREWNVYQDAQAADYVVRHWPVPIVFSGFEVGKDVLTGAGLQKADRPNPVRRGYELHNGLTDRPSWDQVAVYYAVITADGQKTDLWSKVYGRNMIRPDGGNYWLNQRDDTVDHAYLVQQGDTDRIAGLLERLMLTAGQK